MIKPNPQHCEDKNVDASATLPANLCHCHTGCNSKRCPCNRKALMCSTFCHQGNSCTNCFKMAVPAVSIATKDAICINLTEAVDKAVYMCEPYIAIDASKSALTATHHEVLCSKQWLDDRLINLGQNMMKQQHPYINGLQSVLLGQNLSFIPQGDDCVQILHEFGNHWITVSNIGYPPSTINVYDSLHGSLSTHTQHVIADNLQSKTSQITIRNQYCQRQSNSYDCGLFALANATALCNGINPTPLVYIQSVMRKHFMKCIEGGILSPFPTKLKKRKIQPPDVTYICA